MLAEAAAAGGKILKPAADTFWGGYSAYFADPDGHAWEVAWNPEWTLADDGSVRLARRSGALSSMPNAGPLAERTHGRGMNLASTDRS